MNPEKLPIKKYGPEELKREIGYKDKPNLRLVKDEKDDAWIKETEEERSERFIRQTEAGIASQLNKKEENPQRNVQEGMQ